MGTLFSCCVRRCMCTVTQFAFWLGCVARPFSLVASGIKPADLAELNNSLMPQHIKVCYCWFAHDTVGVLTFRGAWHLR